MAEDQQIGFTLSVKSEQFVRAMREVEESRKRVDRVFAQSTASKGDGLFGIGRAKQAQAELRAVAREHEAIKHSMDAQVAAGRQISDQDRQRLRVLESQRRLLQTEISRSGTATTAARAVGSSITRASGFAGGAAQFAFGNPAPMVNALSAVPLLGPGLGMIAASALQQIMMGKAVLFQNLLGTSATGAATGITRRSMGLYGNFGLRHAYTRAQTLEHLGAYAQSAGSSEGFAKNLRMRRGYGIDTSEFVGASRQLGGDSASDVQLALVRGIESGAFNRALAREFVSASTSIVGQIAAAGGQGSAANVAGMVAAISQRLGGDYARSPQRSASLLGGVNQALMGFAGGQGGDAKQAFLFEALRSANPKADYIDLLIKAEKGVSDPSNVNAILKSIKRRYSDPKMQALAFSRLTGRSVKEGLDVIAAGDIKPIEQGGEDAALRKRAKEGMRGLSAIQRENALGEKRATVAAKAEPMMARYNELQLQAVGLLGKVVERLSALLGQNPSGVKTGAGWRGYERTEEISGGDLTLQKRNAEPSRPSPRGGK